MQIHTLISSENGPIILWVMYPHRGDELEHTADSIRELVGEEQFTLVAIQVNDWNRDLSPWRSNEVDGTANIHMTFIGFPTVRSFMIYKPPWAMIIYWYNV